VSAVIVAAGSASRMNGIDKMFHTAGGIPVVAYSLRAFEGCEIVDEIVVVCREGEQQQYTDMAETLSITKFRAAVPGGATRDRSVAAGVDACAGTPDNRLVAIHDGARPLVTGEIIVRTALAAAQCGAAACAVPCKDTIKVINDDDVITASPPRYNLRAVQTPQIFDMQLYRSALAYASGVGFGGTDDCELAAAYAEASSIELSVKLVMGEYTNIKITTPEDLRIMAALIAEREDNTMRIGHGYDVHRFEAGRKLIIGGVDIPYEMGLLGHSDADVLAHAISDALLGAAGLGDIGAHFPDTDPAYKNADSIKLLAHVCGLLASRGMKPFNIDATIVAQCPKMSPHIAQMRCNIAAAAGIEIDSVNIKATTEEGLGFTGAGQGIAAHAVCTIRSNV